jgi:hypothetical protein
MSYYRRAKIAGEDVIEEPAQEPEAIVGDSFQVYDEETRGGYISGPDALDLSIDETIGEAE